MPPSRGIAADMSDVVDGLCFLCGAHGPAGLPCPSATCQTRDLHFVPAPDWQPGTTDPLLGRVIGGFLVVGVLGSGGFGHVHRVLQLPIRARPLQGALKRLRPPTGDSPSALRQHRDLIERFESEADALASLSHPNVVRLLKTGLEGDTPFLVLELVTDAHTLERVLDDLRQRGEPMPEPELMAIVDQTLNALEAAHHKGIIHRDVKPGNLMLQRVAGYDTFVRVLDFGLAKFIAESSDTQRVMGTLDYMAPEQFHGRDIGPWTDLYSLGLLLLAMLTGQTGFAAERAVLLKQKLDPAHDPVGLATAGRDLDATILRFLRRALAFDHAARHEDVPAFRAAFEDAFAGLKPRRERVVARTRDLAESGARPRAGHGAEVIRLKPPTRIPDTHPAPTATASDPSTATPPHRFEWFLGGHPPPGPAPLPPPPPTPWTPPPPMADPTSAARWPLLLAATQRRERGASVGPQTPLRYLTPTPKPSPRPSELGPRRSDTRVSPDWLLAQAEEQPTDAFARSTEILEGAPRTPED